MWNKVEDKLPEAKEEVRDNEDKLILHSSERVLVKFGKDKLIVEAHLGIDKNGVHDWYCNVLEDVLDDVVEWIEVPN